MPSQRQQSVPGLHDRKATVERFVVVKDLFSRSSADA
jgi:hypothetical protein